VKAIITYFQSRQDARMVNAWIAGKPVGEGVVNGATLERTAHIGYIGIGILKDFWGYGIGQGVMAKLEEYAIGYGMERLEFTVLGHNKRGQDFYRRLGYYEEGRRRNSVRYEAGSDGISRYGDEIIMAKWIGPDFARPV
jgi:RimJ/RimL family protein N-acetyltransferase